MKHRELRPAILAAMGTMSRYSLTKAAQEYCPKLTETAVGEYLDGKRDMQASRVEGLLKALNLRISR